MTHVYMLWHIHDLGDEEDWKFVGVYSSQAQVDAARERVSRLPGFRDTPDKFKVERVAPDEDLWTEGFVTVDEGDDEEDGVDEDGGGEDGGEEEGSEEDDGDRDVDRGRN